MTANTRCVCLRRGYRIEVECRNGGCISSRAPDCRGFDGDTSTLSNKCSLSLLAYSPTNLLLTLQNAMEHAQASRKMIEASILPNNEVTVERVRVLVRAYIQIGLENEFLERWKEGVDAYRNARHLAEVSRSLSVLPVLTTSTSCPEEHTWIRQCDTTGGGNAGRCWQAKTYNMLMPIAIPQPQNVTMCPPHTTTCEVTFLFLCHVAGVPRWTVDCSGARKVCEAEVAQVSDSAKVQTGD